MSDTDIYNKPEPDTDIYNELLGQLEYADFNQLKGILRTILTDLNSAGIGKNRKTEDTRLETLHTTVQPDVTTTVKDGKTPVSTTEVIPAVPVSNFPDENPVPTPYTGV